MVRGVCYPAMQALARWAPARKQSVKLGLAALFAGVVVLRVLLEQVLATGVRIWPAR